MRDHDARSDVPTLTAIVLVVLAFLFCPGCSVAAAAFGWFQPVTR